MSFAAPLTADDAAIFDGAVIPRYLSFFGGLVCDMMIPHPAAQIAHVGCRTGFPDIAISEKLPNASIFGVDASAAALEIARNNVSLASNVRASYHVAEALPTPLNEGAFTHAFSIHPVCDIEGRAGLLKELRRVLVPGGQALVALPLRGSFPEIADMLREHALRHDLSDLGKAIDIAAHARPTIETIAEELEAAGLDEVDVDVQLIAVSFASGREFLEDPIARLLVLPESTIGLGADPAVLEPAMKYVHDAVQKYWSEGVFELTVNVGCASARKM